MTPAPRPRSRHDARGMGGPVRGSRRHRRRHRSAGLATAGPHPVGDRARGHHVRRRALVGLQRAHPRVRVRGVPERLPRAAHGRGRPGRRRHLRPRPDHRRPVLAADPAHARAAGRRAGRHGRAGGPARDPGPGPRRSRPRWPRRRAGGVPRAGLRRPHAVLLRGHRRLLRTSGPPVADRRRRLPTADRRAAARRGRRDGRQRADHRAAARRPRCRHHTALLPGDRSGQLLGGAAARLPPTRARRAGAGRGHRAGRGPGGRPLGRAPRPQPRGSSAAGTPPAGPGCRRPRGPSAHRDRRRPRAGGARACRAARRAPPRRGRRRPVDGHPGHPRRGLPGPLPRADPGRPGRQ